MNKSVGTVVLKYIDRLDALAHSFPHVMHAAKNAAASSKEHWLDYLKKNSTGLVERDGGKFYEIPAEHMRQTARKKRRHENLKVALEILPRNYLVSFVSEYDAFLGNLISELFSLRPELLNTCERELTFAELVSFPTIEDARKYILEKEIEGVLRKSHAEQFKWMENKFSIKLREGLASWSQFIEITERRNLFVHCEGVVSSQYLEVCKENQVDITGAKVGDVLSVDPAYLSNVYQCLYEIGVKLSQVLWRKLTPTDMDQADRNLVHVVYELLASEQYKTAIRLLDFSVDTLKTHTSEVYKRIYVINRSLAYKYSGDEAKAHKIVDTLDWSACGRNFQIAVSAIKDKDEDVYRIMREIGTSGEVSAASYIEWPLFKRLREKSEFLAVYAEIFGKPFERAEVVELSSLSANEEAAASGNA